MLCLLPAYPALGLLSCPLSPQPPLAERSSPVGKGEFFCFLMQGASPLASPRLSRKRHWCRGRTTCPAGACPVGYRLTLPLWCPAGGVLCLLPAYPAFGLLSCPLSPCPPSRREGGDFLLSYARGFAPCIPGGWAGRGTGFACGKPVLSASNGALAPAGAAGIWAKKSPPPHRGACVAGAVSAVDGSVQGCRGRSPRQNKLLVPPSRWEGGLGGWGQETKLKAG